MRVISLVPSWTETLIAAGVEVVGRSRYCLYPKQEVGSISVVGGTKDIDWEKVALCKPDLLILDREENPKKMAVDCPFRWISTHVQSLYDLPKELLLLSNVLGNETLKGFSERYSAAIQSKPKFVSWENPNLALEWWAFPQGQAIDRIEYVIWREPWMVVSRDTFIGSVMEWMGWGQWLRAGPIKYPQVLDSSDFLPNTLFLFSSEPYPFAKFKEYAVQLGGASALVDGELFSWFGLRNLRFLEKMSGVKN